MTPNSKFSPNSRLRWLSLRAMPLLFVALASCASNYGGPINGQRALSPEEQRLQAVETKQTEISRRLDAVQAAQQNGTSTDEVRNLRGQVEQLRYDVDQLQKQQAQVNDIDQRLKRLESGGAAAPVGGLNSPATAITNPPVVPSATTGAAAIAPSAPTSASAASPSADEEGIYMRSFDLLKAAKYDDAIGGFKGMLAKYPQGNYADNAWYWMGQSYHIKRDYPNALKSFQSLLQGFPASPKVPDALLETGEVYQEQQQSAQARAAFQKVLTSYPASSAATQARTRLAQLK